MTQHPTPPGRRASSASCRGARTTVMAAAAAVMAAAVTGCSSAHHTPAAPASSAAPVTSTPAPAGSGLATGGGSVQPYPTGSTRPDPRGMPAGTAAVNRADPAATATGFVVATWAQDGRIDTSPWNALDRSAALATPQYAATLDRPLAAAPGAAWNQMAAAGAYTTVAVTQVTSDDNPVQTPTRQFFTFAVTITTHGAPVPTQQLTMLVVVTRPTTAQPWQVASSETSQ